MPIPPAAFSPLTTMKVGLVLLAQDGQQRLERPAARHGPRRRRRTGSRCRAPWPARRYRPRGAYFDGDADASGSGQPAARAASRRCCCRAGCSSCCSRWRSSASSRSCAPPGPIAAAVHRRRADRAAAQPVRDAAAPRSLPARARGADRDGVRGPRRDGDRLPAGQPGGRPGVGVPAERPGDRRRREHVAGGLPGLAGPQRDRRAGQGGGLDRAADARAQPLGGLGRARVVHQRRAADPRRGLDRADPRDRPERLHAALRRADRAGRPLGGAARRRHAGGRLPDPHPGRGVRLRARPAAVLADHGHQRRRAAVGPRLARDLPRGQDVRGRLRRLVRLRRADPVHRPRGRRVPAGA